MLMSLVNSLIHSRRHCFGLIATNARASEVLRTSGEVDDYCRHASRLSASHYATGIAHVSVHLHYVRAVQIKLYSRSSQTDSLKITKLVAYSFIIINSLYKHI